MAVLEWSLYNNPLRAWLVALLVAVIVFAALRLTRKLIERQLTRLATRTHTYLDNATLALLHATRWWFLAAVALSAGSLFLVLAATIRTAVITLVELVTLVQLGIWGATAVRTYITRYSERKLQDDAASVTSVRALGFLLTVALWATILLVALGTLGIDITALVAGLGIGGVAVALAVQNILGDLFASLSIVLDKPFVYGDFVVVDDFSGTVEHIGLKTTRLRSLTGEQLVFSNSDLLKSRIRNYRSMLERRVAFSFGVVFQTPRPALERIPAIVRETIEALPDTRFDRAHFKTIGPSSFDFEVVYYVLSPDYALYMDRQQAINLALLDRFATEGIDFAYPARTVFVANPGE